MIVPQAEKLNSDAPRDTSRPGASHAARTTVAVDRRSTLELLYRTPGAT
jgi:hypothetical protein